MLAARAESELDIVYPCLATPKIDGIRCLRVGEHARTRSFKHVQNEHIRELVKTLPEGVDGELVAGTDTAFNFQATASAVMRRTGEPTFRYWVFDWYNGDGACYWDRTLRISQLTQPFVVHVLPVFVESADALVEYEKACLQQGFEGVCTRDPYGPYLFGRSTLKQQYLVKLKRYIDSEMRVTGFLERMHNTNEQVSDEFGYARRPGGAANHTPMDTLGSFVGVDVETGVEVRVGSGMDDELRARVWADQASYIGKLITYRHQPTGVKDKRRFTSFLRFREPE